MVLEEFFKPDWVKHRPYLTFIFGFFYTFIAFFITAFFFRGMMSVAMVFLTTILLVPTLLMLIKKEENIERKYGLKNFFKNHKDIFEAYLFSFLGVFFAFVVLGLVTYNNPEVYGSLFDFQSRFLEFQNVDYGVIDGFVAGTMQPSALHVLDIFAHDVIVVMICFILSLFYGASAIFLIILNGSIFASFIVLVIRTIGQDAMAGLQAFLFFLIHLIPEISGFLIAAIAGGVISKAILHEEKGSKAFKNVFKDATVLILIAVGLVLLAAVLEVFVTARLFQVFF